MTRKVLVLKLNTHSMTAWLTAAVQQQTDKSEEPEDGVKASGLERSTVYMMYL